MDPTKTEADDRQRLEAEVNRLQSRLAAMETAHGVRGECSFDVPHTPHSPTRPMNYESPEAWDHVIAGTAGATSDEVFYSLVQHLAEASGARDALVTKLVGPGRQRLRSVSYWRSGRLVEPVEYDINRTPCQVTLEQGEYFCSTGVVDHFPDDEDLVVMGIDSYHAVRIDGPDGQVMGKVSVLSDRPVPDTPQLRTMLRLFAARAGVELQRQQDTYRLKLFRALVDHSSDAMEVIDPFTGRLLDVNQKSCELHGYARDEYLHLRAAKLDASVTDCRLQAMVAQLQTERTMKCTTRRLHRDGSTFPADVAYSYVRLDRDYLLATVHAALEPARAEAELREKQVLLETMIKNTPAAVAMFDTDMRYLAWSKRWQSDYRLGRRDLEGLCHYDIFPEIGADWRAVHRRCLAGATESREPEPFPRQDGTCDFVRWQILPWRHADGTIGGLIIFTEVLTEQHRSEEMLREISERWHLAVDATNLGSWDWNPETNELMVSAEWKRQLGYREGELKNHYDEWLSRLHPDDRKPTIAALEAYLEGRSARYAAEFRLRHKDGSYRWIDSRGVALRDASGQVTRMIGWHADITERKASDAVIRRSDNLLRGIARTHQQFLVDGDLRQAFAAMLDLLLDATESELGFIGEVPREVDPELATEPPVVVSQHRLSQRELPYDDLQRLVGWLAESGAPALVNGGAAARAAPTRQLQIHTFLGLPFYDGSDMVGVIGVANRERGYDEDVTQALWSVLATCSSLVHASREERQRCAAEAKLRESEAEYRMISESIYEAIITIDDEGQIRYANPAASAVFGYRVDELVGRPIGILIPPTRRRRALAAIEQLMQTEQPVPRASLEAEGLHKDGSTVELELSYGEHTRDGRRYFTSVIRNVSERRRIEAELKQREAELAHVGRLSTLGEAVAEIAHEINQPLYSIANYSQACLNKLAEPSERSDDEMRKWLHAIHQASTRSSDVLQSIAGFLRRDDSHRSVVPAAQVVRDAMRLLDWKIARSPVEVQVHGLETDILVEVDRVQIEQVLLNLLLNACDAIHDARVANGRIELRLQQTGQAAEVTVADNGPGIAEEVRSRLFDPFVTTKPTGLGMGLAISRSIIEDNGGRIWHEPTCPQGACFHLLLPIHSKGADG